MLHILHLCNILCASQETFVSAKECWKLYSITDCIVNIKVSVDELKKSMAVSGCWKRNWPEAVNNVWGFLSQQDKVRNIYVLACEVPGEGFPRLEEGDIREVFGCHAAELTDEEEDLEQLTGLSEPQHEDSDVVVGRSDLTTSALKKSLQIVDDLVDCFMDRCTKFKQEMEVVMVPFKGFIRTRRRRQSN
jgi:hypothetical protein